MYGKDKNPLPMTEGSQNLKRYEAVNFLHRKFVSENIENIFPFISLHLNSDGLYCIFFDI